MTSGGILSASSRCNWERNLFAHHYDHVGTTRKNDAGEDIDLDTDIRRRSDLPLNRGEAKDRVKYGAINVTRDPTGAPRCSNYGKCFFTLKKDVRVRCTMANQDSSGVDGQDLATCDYYANVLQQFNDREFCAICRLVSKRRKSNRAAREWKHCN